MIKIYTFSHKRPDFLELQLQSFKKNVRDEFEFIVFNNANFDINRQQYDEIHTFCTNNKLTCIDVQKEQELINMAQAHETCPLFNSDGTYSNAAIACAYPLCWAWTQHISKTEDKICIIDSDMFVVESIDFSSLLNKYQLSFVCQSRVASNNAIIVAYMWNGLVLANLIKLPDKETINWWCGKVRGHPVDVGGQTYKYLEEHLDLKLLHVRSQIITDTNDVCFHPSNYEWLWLEDNRAILHYRSGSNWNYMTPEYHISKTKWLKHKLNS